MERRRTAAAATLERRAGRREPLRACAHPLARRAAAKVAIETGRGALLPGELTMPPDGAARGVVLLAAGPGASRQRSGNRQAARLFNANGLATLTLDLLTEIEERYLAGMFDAELLAQRLLAATRWLGRRADTRSLPVGYFATGSGTAPALRAAAQSHASTCAVLAGGDRAGVLGRARAPMLLIVGDGDATAPARATRWFTEHIGEGAAAAAVTAREHE